MWFQSLLKEDMALVYWEGDDPRAALQEFASSEDHFDEWLRERGREVYQFEPDQPLSTSSLLPPWLLPCAQSYCARYNSSWEGSRVRETLSDDRAYFQRFSKTPGQETTIVGVGKAPGDLVVLPREHYAYFGPFLPMVWGEALIRVSPGVGFKQTSRG